MTFIDKVLAGEEFEDQIDNYIETWHREPNDLELHDYLGLTEQEYALWVEQPESLRSILFTRKMGKLSQVEDWDAAHLIAARSQSQQDPEVLLTWLRKKGLL